MPTPPVPHGPSNQAPSPPLPKAQRFTQMFNNIDSAGSGSITESQFGQALSNVTLANEQTITQVGNVYLPRPFGNDASSIWSQIDTNDSANLTEQQFVTGMSTLLLTLRAEGSALPTSGNSAQMSVAGSLINTRA